MYISTYYIHMTDVALNVDANFAEAVIQLKRYKKYTKEIFVY